MVIMDLCKVPTTPVGGSVESYIILQREAFNFELVRFCSIACVCVRAFCVVHYLIMQKVQRVLHNCLR